MIIFRDYKNISDKYKHKVVAIGNLDGLHHGHKYLLSGGIKPFNSKNNRISVITFEPHPVKILRPEHWKKRLVRFRTKIRLLEKLGIEVLYILRFNKNFSALKSNEFVEKILISSLEVKKIIVGEDFRFGFNREGDVSLLKKYVKKEDFDLEIVKQKSINGKICSSSLLRRLIKEGNIKEVFQYLGYYWEVEGKVIRGEARGRKLGYPTANLNYCDQIFPSNGIYSAWVKIEDENTWRMSAVSTGVRPHFGEGERLLEAHLLDYKGDLYGKRIRVAFVSKIREEMAFNSTYKLIDNIKSDCEIIKEELKQNSEIKTLNL